MQARSERVDFANKRGERLAARLELPGGVPQAYAIFAHCFTCSKDFPVVTHISRALTAHGVAVLRFDFTGLGNSEGDFANTNFSSNVEDLLCAADYLRDIGPGAQLLLGHSLGGAAVLAAAADIAESRAIVTIAAPSSTQHLETLLADQLHGIEAAGEVQVHIGGRGFAIRQQLLDDIRALTLAHKVEALAKPLLVFHSPQDETVPIEHAYELFALAQHPKGFISLDRADHVLSDREDAKYVTDLIAAWSQRYLGLS